MINDEDHHKVSGFPWILFKNGAGNYAIYRFADKLILMHNIILPPTDDSLTVDHKDRNGLNNQRENLRLATSTQQKANRGLNRNSYSGYKGVSFLRKTNKWRAYINKPYKQVHLGNFNTAEEAAAAYNLAALRLYGEFACLNML